MSGDTVVKESVTGLVHGHKSVGTSVVPLYDFPLTFPANKGVLLRCPGAGDATPNTVEVWVGGPGVTGDSAEGSGGIPIAPGEALFIPIEEPALLYVVAGAASQDIAWMAI